jgi:hypothetical protein
MGQTEIPAEGGSCYVERLYGELEVGLSGTAGFGERQLGGIFLYIGKARSDSIDRSRRRCSR